MTSLPTNPRRRAAAGDSAAQPSLPKIDSQICADPEHLSALQKGATFHSPTSPATESDPTIDVGRLPRRTPTSPKALEDLLASVNKRVDGLLKDFGELALSAKEANGSTNTKERPLPNPAFILEHAASNLDGSSNDNNRVTQDPFNLNDKADKIEAAAAAAAAASSNSSHSHESDSGIGSSVSGDSAPSSPILNARSPSPKSSARRSSVYTPLGGSKTGATAHALDDRAAATVKKYVLAPLLAQERLKPFHPILLEVPRRIAKKQITCLRDVEKTLILSAPARSKDPAAYLTFVETAIQCVHTTTAHLNDRDLRRPADKAYTNNYFVDLVEQVRQYARIMEAYRIKRAEDKAAAEKNDYKPGEKIVIQGGSAGKDGQLEPLRLVREKDGEMIPIEADEMLMDEVEDDDDVERSMARKRKCDIGKEEIRACRECGKEFKRPCDLTKHEKTHSRPWKCSDAGCKYHTLGWPTEKERDRHVNDKHSSMPLLYRCLYKPCAYTSKRESNCKQHMEKAHGWEYVRSKAKKGQSLVPTAASPEQAPTPMSGLGSLSTPLTNASYSPSLGVANSLSPAESAATGSGFSDSTMYTHSLLGNYQSPYDDQTFDFNDFGNELHQSDSRQSDGVDSMASSGFSFGSDAAFTQNGFDPNVNLGDINWPPMQPDDFFPNWDPTIQQPTPTNSDYKDVDAPMLDFSLPPASLQKPNIVLQTPDDDENQHVSYEPSGQDFPLFGEIGPTGGESSQMGSMFPELGTVGDQFGTDPMFDSMATGALDEYTNIN